MNPIFAMQQAVDIVLSSPHPDNKIAATLFKNQESISKTNEWPPIILEKLGMNKRIGDSSGTIHAEINCIMDAKFKVEGANLAITDPCCPNCAKCIAEAGIKSVYIDHKGFQKDFAVRRGGEFQDMSLRILAHAGINIYEVARKEKKITTLYEAPIDYIPPEDNPIEIRPCNQSVSLQTLMKALGLVKVKHERWGCALATDKNGKVFTLVASAHPAIGYTERNIEDSDGKYDFFLEPVNRLIIGSAREGLTLSNTLLWCSVLPSPREMINLISGNFEKIYIGNTEKAKKDASIEAKETLESRGILLFERLSID